MGQPRLSGLQYRNPRDLTTEANVYGVKNRDAHYCSIRCIYYCVYFVSQRIDKERGYESSDGQVGQ